MTISEAVAGARQRLAAGGVPADEAPGDADVLARHALGWDLTHYAAGLRDAAPAGFLQAYDGLIARRLRREPVSQIVGHREFWGLEFEVTRDVLTPRPETELVVQAALDLCPTRPISPIVDVGTGSGCIATALAMELPDARFIASDASLAALKLARRNAERHGVANRIAFLHTDVVPPQAGAGMIVSNPPYIPVELRDSLPPEVRDYEPAIALFGGVDGLDVYRKLLRDDRGGNSAEERGTLEEGGWLIVEVGYDQANAVRALADPQFWEPGRTYTDLQGIERVLTFRAVGAPQRVDE